MRLASERLLSENVHVCVFLKVAIMNNLHYRLNFDPCKMSKIFHHSSKEQPKIRKIVKFGFKIS